MPLYFGSVVPVCVQDGGRCSAASMCLGFSLVLHTDVSPGAVREGFIFYTYPTLYSDAGHRNHSVHEKSWATLKQPCSQLTEATVSLQSP